MPQGTSIHQPIVFSLFVVVDLPHDEVLAVEAAFQRAGLPALWHFDDDGHHQLQVPREMLDLAIAQSLLCPHSVRASMKSMTS
jgi:hypothetical protein